MRKLIALKDLDTNDFVIKWRITQMCNLHCSYCIRPRYIEFNKQDLIDAEQDLCDASVKLSNLIGRTPFNNVKIDLIGGEVSIFNLEKILNGLNSNKLKRINITTNFIKPAEYYISLADFLNSKNIELTMTASFHFEFQDMESYFSKVEKVFNHCKLFVCEMVSTDNNKDICLEFIDKCEKLNIDYMVETDLRMEKTEERESGNYISIVNKKIKNPRYKAMFEDGSIQIYGSRNNFLCDDSVDINVMKNRVNCGGFYCTNSWNYIYVDYNFIRGRKSKDTNCREIIQLDDFNIVEPAPCKSISCTICGHMSLYKTKELINDYIFSKHV